MNGFCSDGSWLVFIFVFPNNKRMKYLYTSLFVLLASYGFSQSFEWAHVGDTHIVELANPADVASGDIEYDVDFHSELRNNTGEDMEVRWRITDFTPSSGEWDAYMCEEVICWQSWTITPTSVVTVPAMGTFQLYTHVQMLVELGSGDITVCTHALNDSANTYSCYTYTAMVEEDSALSVGEIDGAPQGQLAQNAPNPFKDNAVIRYETRSENGLIRIHDLTGKIVDEIVLTSRSGAVTVGNALRSGVYFYSLWDNGELIDTKRMQVID